MHLPLIFRWKNEFYYRRASCPTYGLATRFQQLALPISSQKLKQCMNIASDSSVETYPVTNQIN